MPIVGAYLSTPRTHANGRRYFGGRSYPTNMLGDDPRLMFTMMKASPVHQPQAERRTEAAYVTPHVRSAQIIASTGGHVPPPITTRTVTPSSQGATARVTPRAQPQEKTTPEQLAALRKLGARQEQAARIRAMSPEQKEEMGRRMRAIMGRGVMKVVEPADVDDNDADDDDEEESGIVSKLWPTDKPIYARPGAIGGVVLVAVGVIAYFKLRSKP